ncbi:hypothetical protein NDI56_07225 [Haloarcula sp. S1CR25-12]|uniref:Uncharacterized protein n=1 Tax=Haloarcula saliterrae TaxID=2950534 RepID=A0ABU2FAD1_9EURY|nr:hypothetical protein [Haloarcula sp. S1CR25-12]MDS0259181.1 hypothetical protein [Haloarcula sp. S1CR25-12]
MVDRGQAYTLEGVLAAILVVTATVYGLQAIDTRAWEDTTRGETQELKHRASDVLTLAGESGALRDAVLCFSSARAIDGDRPEPRSTFESMLNTTFDSQADQYNLYFSYWNESESRETRLVSETSQESDRRPPTSAAAASTTVTLTDGMDIRNGNRCNSIPIDIQDDSEFYIQKDTDEKSSLYNVVEVRLVVW